MPAKDAHVQVYILPGQTPNHKLTSTDIPIGPDGELIFRNCHHDGFHVFFDLQDPTQGYLFPPNSQKGDAVYSELGNLKTCPTANPSSPQDKVFEPLNVSSDRKTLKVRNPNQGSVLGKFGYSLRVVDGAGQPLLLDPGGDNMNGPISFNEWRAVIIGVGSALATTALIAAGLYLAGFQLVSRF